MCGGISNSFTKQRTINIVLYDCKRVSRPSEHEIKTSKSNFESLALTLWMKFYLDLNECSTKMQNSQPPHRKKLSISYRTYGFI